MIVDVVLVQNFMTALPWIEKDQGGQLVNSSQIQSQDAVLSMEKSTFAATIDQLHDHWQSATEPSKKELRQVVETQKAPLILINGNTTCWVRFECERIIVRPLSI